MFDFTKFLPEIKVNPEIILVIQFRHLGGNLAKAVSAKSKTFCGIKGSGSKISESSKISSSQAESVSFPFSLKTSGW